VGGDPLDLPTDRFLELLQMADETDAAKRGDYETAEKLRRARLADRVNRVMGL
jgi:hypothetical protein